MSAAVLQPSIYENVNVRVTVPHARLLAGSLEITVENEDYLETYKAIQTIGEIWKENVYYDYAPLGVSLEEGKPAIHLLIAPQQYRENFLSLTPEESIEASFYIKAVEDHYRERNVTCYRMHRTGRLLQSVWHHHEHLIINPDQADLQGKMTVLFKMLFGGRVLSPAQLESSINTLKEDLQRPLQNAKTEFLQRPVFSRL